MKLNRRITILILFLSCIIPAILYLVYLFKFGVDIPFLDQWLFAPMLKAFYSGENWLQYLFEQHNEHRIVVPRLIFLFLAKLTDWNTFGEMVTSFLVCLLNFGLIWLILKQTNIKSKLILIPLSWIIFTLGQWQNIIWGWELAWYLAVFGILSAVLYLSKTPFSNWYIIPAIIGAIIATFSLANGLLVWPMGLFLLWFLKSKPGMKTNLAFIWLVIGIFICGVYFMDYAKPGHLPPLSAALIEPLKFLRYILANLGAGLGGGDLTQCTVIGVLLVLIFGIAVYLLKRISKERMYELMPWIILGLFVIVSSTSIAVGRVGRGAGQAISARYVTITSLLIISDIVLCLALLKEYARKDLIIGLNAVLYVLIIFGLFTTTKMAWGMGRQTYLERMKSVAYLKQFEYAPDNALALLFYPDPPYLVRDASRFLKEKKLSIFRKSEDFNLSAYREINPPKEFPIGIIDGMEIISVPTGGPSLPSEHIFHVWGWAIDPTAGKSPKAVFILCDNNILGRAYSGNTRHDVAKIFQNDNLITSGWDFFIPKKLIPSGAHKFTARILFLDSLNYIDVSKEIIIPLHY